MPERQREEVPEAAVTVVRRFRQRANVDPRQAGAIARHTLCLEEAVDALEAALVALGEERLVPYGQARAEVLGEALEVLRGHADSRTPARGNLAEIAAVRVAADFLARHFDLPTQGVREEGERRG